MINGRRTIIAVPVKDEAERLTGCLQALTRQDRQHEYEVLVLVNNSSDESAALARRFAVTSPVPIVVEDMVLPRCAANAGNARRLAMQLAAERVGAAGVLLTTDADGRVPPNWLSANLRAIDRGADAVAGRARMDVREEALLPTSLRSADAQERVYAALLDEISARMDPDPADPLPRHDEHPGASIAVTARAFRLVGGIPKVTVGEDRAFFRSLRRVDASIRHAPDVQVTVSGRIDGRAAEGMAATVRRRLIRPDEFLDDRLEPAAYAALRAALRRRMRSLWIAGQAAGPYVVESVARHLRIAPGIVWSALSVPHFGTAWEAVEEASPILRRRRVAAGSVLRETWLARTIADGLRAAGEQMSRGSRTRPGAGLQERIPAWASYEVYTTALYRAASADWRFNIAACSVQAMGCGGSPKQLSDRWTAR